MSVHDATGRPVECVGPERRGGEGSVFRVAGRPDVAAKILHPNRRDAERRRKLASMAATPPKDPTWAGRRHRSIAWVDGLLYADPGRRDIVGFTMPFVDTDTFRQAHTYYDPDDRLRRFGGGYTWRHLLTAACNLSSAVAAVHAQGHRVGDLRDTNVLVSPTSLVTLIDCDSFQIVDASTGELYPTRVGTGDVLPPELQGVDFAAGPVDRYHADLFALAVLVFRFLMLGVHPFQARGPAVEDAPSTEAKIVRGLYPYAGRARGVRPPEYAPDYSILPPSLRGLFKRAFVDGHARAEARPAATEWLATLTSEGRRLKQCRANANHWFAASARSCSWCAVARASGSDAFPRSVGAQVEAGRPSAETVDGRREHLRSYVRLALVDDQVSQAERDYLDRLGATLGLRSPDLDALIEAERRAAAPAPAPRAPLVRRRLSLPPVRAFLTGDALARAALLGVAALAGALAPVAGLVVAAAVVVPSLATAGHAMRDRASGVSRPRVAALSAGRLAGNAYRSLVLAAPLGVPFALAAALPLAALARFASVAIAARVAGAAATAGLLWWSLGRGDQDEMLASARLARDRVLCALVSPAGRPTRVSAVVWVGCVALGAALWLGVSWWWPLRLA